MIRLSLSSRDIERLSISTWAAAAELMLANTGKGSSASDADADEPCSALQCNREWVT